MFVVTVCPVCCYSVLSSCQRMDGLLVNQNPDYVARISVVTPAGSLVNLAPSPTSTETASHR